MRLLLVLGLPVCLVCLVSMSPAPTGAADAEEIAAQISQAETMTFAASDDKSDADKAAPSRADKPKKEAKSKGEKAKSAARHAGAKKPIVVHFTITGSYPEGPTSLGLFGDMQPSLASAIERMDQAADDKTVAAVWLRVEGLDLGRGKVHELRAAVGRIRKAGKPVYAEICSADTAEYLVASACDEVVMPSSGVLTIPGVRAEITFYKGLLDKVGVEFDVLQMGRYKGAAEPFTRTSMSPALRESFEALVDDTYEHLASTIADDRKMKDYQVKTLLDQGLFTAAAAKKAGLIDQVVYADQFEDSLRKKLKADAVEVVRDYKKKRIDTDFSGFSGMMKLMELVLGGKPSEKAGKQKKIAVVYAVGEIVEGKGASDLFGESAIGSSSFVSTLRKAAEDPKVVAVVLRIDSPGGSAVASDLIWRETVRIKKPLVASMGDVAGSGGYYIAMGAKKIFAEPGTLTGSIGVVGGKVVLRGLYDKLGVSTEVISRGEKSGSFSSTQPFTPEERKAWTALLQETYHQFVSKAAQGRKLSYQELEKHAQGRVYTGRMAKAIGLVDELGTLQDAIAEAKKAAGLKADEPVDLMILPRPQTIFEQIFGDASISSEFDAIPPELLKPLRQARLWRRLFAERTLLWMPFAVKVK
jgi:protease IV